jgi:ketosteroid isomerase-like protein
MIRTVFVLACVWAFAPSTAAAPVVVSTTEAFVREFDSAWSSNDVEAAVALFAPDATLETPLAQRVLHRKDGVLHGREEIRAMVSALMSGGRGWGGHEPPIVRGNTLAIEFRRAGSDGEHYSVDIIELKDGKIQSLRAYVGWRAAAPSADGDRP